MLIPRSNRARCMPGITAALITLSFACVAQAEDGEAFKRKGIFLGVSGIYAIPTESENKLERETCADQCNVEVDESFGLNLSVGYRHSEHLWSQLEVEYFTGLEATSDTFSRSREYAIVTTTGNLIAGIPLGPLRPFLLGGIGFTVVDFNHGGPSQSGLSLRAGGGFDLEITQHISLNIKGSYVATFQDVEDFDYISAGAGLLFHF